MLDPKNAHPLPIEELGALMTRHPFTAEVVTEVYQVLAQQHANAIAATDMALATATAEGRDPLAVAMGMTVPNENTE